MGFTRFVALGDSFTEGVGDTDPTRPNGLRGWADRVAEQLAAHEDDFSYANLAIRGRLVDAVIAEQLDAAVAMNPDLVTLYAGGNDLMRPSVDLDALLARYDDAIGKLVATGATVVVFTAYDTGWAPVFRKLRGRKESPRVFARTKRANPTVQQRAREVVARGGCRSAQRSGQRR